MMIENFFKVIVGFLRAMSKFLSCVIVLFLISAGGAYGDYIEHFERGREHFYEGRFEQAAVEFEESLRLNPLFDEIDRELAREAMKYLEAIALEQEYLAEEIERLRAERISRYVAEKKIAALELEERIRLGIEEKERIRRLIEEEEAKERLRQKEVRLRELKRPKFKFDAGLDLTHIALSNLDFERGNFPEHEPAPDGGHHEVAIVFTDEHFTMQETSLGFTLMPAEWLSFTFETSQERTWGSPYWEAPVPMRGILHDTVNQMFPHIILPRTEVRIIADIPFFPDWTLIDAMILDGTKAYKEYIDQLIPNHYMEIRLPWGIVPMRIKPFLTAARPRIVREAANAMVAGLDLEEPTDPGVPDTLWRDIDLAYFEADLLGFEAKIGRQLFRMGLPVDVDVVADLIGIGVVEELIGMVVGDADAAVASYRTPPIMGLISPRIGAFGLKLEDADPGVCRVRSDHYLTGEELGLELSVAGVLGLIGVELPEDFELPPEMTITAASAARIRREDFDLRDDVQSEILRLPIAAGVRQSGRIGLWETEEGDPWESYEDGPRHWVGSREVGGHAWVGIVPIVVPGERMPFFAAIHKYRSGDDPATPNICEAFDPIPQDMLFFPLDPAALLPGGLPIELPEGFDIGTNMRYQLYTAGFRPSEELTLIGLYAELDRARLIPCDRSLLDEARGWPERAGKDFMQMAGLVSIFTWRGIGFTLAGLGIRPEDAAYDAMQDFVDEIQIEGGLWAPGDPLPEPLVRSKEWMRILMGMITVAPTEHTTLIVGAAAIDPRDHLFNILNAIIYYDARGALEEAIGGEIALLPWDLLNIRVDVDMDPLEEFAEPFMDDPAIAFFMRLAVNF